MPLMTADAPLRLPAPLTRWLEGVARDLLRPPGMPPVDFASPAGEPALVPPESVSWRVFKNPLTVAVGGIAAVILELAEPRVRHGVWDHSNFRERPLERLQRTGLAAMLTVYGPASAARRMIVGVNAAHARIHGTTSAGLPYRADDPELLGWVQATAAFGFLEAYAGYVRPVPHSERDAYYAEGAPVAGLYGATGAPASQAALERLFAGMRPKLEPSATIDEFLAIMRRLPLLPRPFALAQPLLVKAAVDILPPDLAERLRLTGLRLRPWERATVRTAARTLDRLPLRTLPPVQACRRLGLPEDWLYRR